MMSQRATVAEDAPVNESTPNAIDRWGPVIVVLAAIVLYVRTLGWGLHMDDYVLARPWTWSQIRGTFSGTFDPTEVNDPYFRPFSSISFALEWPLWGTRMWGYHLTNLALHIGAGLGVLALTRRLRVPRWCALVAAVFFVAIPANVTTVVYIAERTDAMVAIATLVALLLVHRFHRTRDRRTLIAINGCLVLAVLAKEVGTAIVPMAACYFWYLQVEALDPTPDSTSVGAHWRHELRVMGRAVVDRSRRADWVRLLGPMFVVVAVYVVYRTAVLPAGSLSDRFGESQNPVRALIGGVNSTFKGVPWEVTGWAYVPAILAVVVAFAVRPTSPVWRVVLLGVGLMIGGVLPLTFSGGVEPRLLYTAEIGLAVMVAGVVAIYAEAIAAGERGRRWLPVAAIALGAAFVAGTLTSTVQSQNRWQVGSDLQLDGAQRVYERPNIDPPLLPEYVQVIEEQLTEGGRPLNPGG